MQKSKLSIILFAGTALAFCAMSAYAVPPKVTKTIPENGDQNVDPGLRKIRIEFDQVMSQDGYSVCGGGPKYPKMIGKPKWINKHTLLMRVKLSPSHEYELSVNCPSYRNFKNLQGESAVIYPIKFKTTAASEKSGTTIKSPSLLLQEGLYAEEVEGNLDAAIEIYLKAVKHAARVEKTAARATYRIGMCYLKKGEKDKAADYFEQITTKFGQQKALAAKAQKQLAKLRPPVNLKLTFGEVIERVIYQGGSPHECLIDFETGKLFKVPESLRYAKKGEREQVLEWIVKTGVDAAGDTAGPTSGPEGSQGLQGVENHMVANNAPGGWDESPELLVTMMRPITPSGKARMFVKGDLPETYYFKTIQGNMGVLQILGFTGSEPRGVRFRYKMLQEPGTRVESAKKLSNLRNARAMLKLMEALAGGIKNAVDDNKDAETGLLLVNRLIEQGKQFQEIVKGTSAEGPAKAFFDMLIPFRQALEKKEIERAKLLWGTLQNLGHAMSESLSSTENVRSEEALRVAQRRLQELRERSESLERLSALGKELAIYANDDEKGRYPDTFSGLTNFHFMKKPDYEWARQFVEYLGKGKTAADTPNTILAYDKYLLQTEKGTNVLYNDTHVEFVEPDRLKKLGIDPAPAKKQTVSVKDKRASENLSANGWQLWGQRKLAEAEKVFERAVGKDPGNANAWNGLGWSQFNQGKNLNAKESFEKCLEIEPKHAAALNGLGWIAKGQKKVDEAIGHWEKAIKAAPTATASLNGLAVTHMERKDYDRAVKYYRMWLDAEPDNAQAKEGLKKATEGK